MYYFYPESNGRVKALLQPKDGKPIEGFKAVEDIPPMPSVGEGNTAHLYYIDDALVWEPIPTVADENGIEIDWDASTEEINKQMAELRRQAYRAEVDELSASYVGYKADAVKARKDGNAELAEQYESIAEAILDQIGDKKAEIRARYPDEVVE